MIDTVAPVSISMLKWCPSISTSAWRGLVCWLGRVNNVYSEESVSHRSCVTWWVALLLSPETGALLWEYWAILLLHTFTICPLLLQKQHTLLIWNNKWIGYVCHHSGNKFLQVCPLQHSHVSVKTFWNLVGVKVFRGPCQMIGVP